MACITVQAGESVYMITEKRKKYLQNYQKIWIANRRKEFFLDKKCAVCGSIKNLELDHVFRETKVQHRIWSWRKERQENELKKCQVLCHFHHLEKTKQENREIYTKISHGTRNTYERHGCRCSECKNVIRIRNAKRTNK